MRIKITLLHIFFLIISYSLTAQIEPEDDVYIKSNFELIYGKYFMYQLKAPSGFNANIQAKSIYEGHIKFIPLTTSYKPFEFYVLDKNSVVADDATGYMTNYYRTTTENVVVNNIEVKNFPYECKAKLFSVPNQFYDYYFYINCGEKYKYWLIATVHSEYRPLNSKELDVFYNTMLSLNPIK